MKVLIAGGGIGGLTTALSCLTRGIDVTVYEQAAAISEVGAGIQISPNASRVLLSLGLGDALESCVFHPEALRLVSDGREIFRISLEHYATRSNGAPYWHIHRADLIDVLKSAVERIAPGRLRTGWRVTGYKQDPHSAELNFDGRQSEKADLIVGADGVHSTIRKAMLGEQSPLFTGNVAWRAVVRTSDALRSIIPPDATVWAGPGRHAVTYYLRRGELINFVGVVEQDHWRHESWSEPGDPAELKSLFARFPKPVTEIIANIETCFRWALYDRPPLTAWTDGRVALLGDASHPMPPFLAQGAAMAIEDSVALAIALSATDEPLEHALRSWEIFRKPRAYRVRDASRANQSVFHKRKTIEKTMAYGPMWLAARFAPMIVQRRQDWLYTYDIENTAQKQISQKRD